MICANIFNNMIIHNINFNTENIANEKFCNDIKDNQVCNNKFFYETEAHDLLEYYGLFVNKIYFDLYESI